MGERKKITRERLKSYATHSNSIENAYEKKNTRNLNQIEESYA